MSSKGSRGDDNGDRFKEDETEIQRIISQDRVVIFSKSTCPYCDNAKKVFDRLGQSYSTVELTTHPKGAEVQSVLKEMTGAGTVPRVFVDGVCIGGGNDTVKMFREGKLEEMLRTKSEDPLNAGNESRDDNRGSGEGFF